MSATVHVLGVRHHGPGSSRSVRAALRAIEPDVVLVEGPPDADALVPLITHEQMAPPVALLIYRPDAPRDAVYYPFAEFSPEWQALTFAVRNGVPARFMDLPAAHYLASEQPEIEAAVERNIETNDANASNGGQAQPASPEADTPSEDLTRRLRSDPLQMLAEAAGFGDGELWWEHVVEHRRDGIDQFAAIREAMAAVRGSLASPTPLRERRREAHMRQTIRSARSQGHERIAVVCGAWHAPALTPEAWPPVKEDAALLKGLLRVKVAATWVPWTYDRLAAESGYGAGIASPGWYDHLWSTQDHVVEHWMSRVARLLRSEGLDASSASVIEAVRLADALAALRERYLPGLDELNEATRTVFCFGDDLPLRLIRRKLIVGERLGSVPRDTPTVPLVQDLEKLQKRLRLRPESSQTIKLLDLREPTDLERSHLLHRLGLLEVPWGQVAEASGRGTFKEAWQLQWQPEFAVNLIEASLWGQTVLDAATAKAKDQAEKARSLPELSKLIEQAILADLPAAVEQIMARLEAQAALASDVTQLMDALPPLANLMRYGNVRQTDAAMVGHAVAGMIARICIGLPGACSSLDDDAAAAMFESIQKADGAIQLLQKPEHLESWHASLARLSASDHLHGLIAGRCCRILLDAHVLDEIETARRMGLAVSTASEPAQAAAWIEGFFKGSGELLLYDEDLFGLIDGWMVSLSADAFTELLPLLRRTFSTFPPPLRRSLGSKAKQTRQEPNRENVSKLDSSDFDTERANRVLPVLIQLLGLADSAPSPPWGEGEG